MVRRLSLLLGCALTALAVTAAAGAGTAVGADCVRPPNLVQHRPRIYRTATFVERSSTATLRSAFSNLNGANLSGAVISGVGAMTVSTVIGANLSGAVISGDVALTFSDLTGANLSRVSVGGQDTLWGSVLRGVNLNNATIGGAQVGCAR